MNRNKPVPDSPAATDVFAELWMDLPCSAVSPRKDQATAEVVQDASIDLYRRRLTARNSGQMVTHYRSLMYRIRPYHKSPIGSAVIPWVDRCETAEALWHGHRTWAFPPGGPAECGVSRKLEPCFQERDHVRR
jgi:hypothetical protein